MTPGDWYVYGAILLRALCSVITRAGYLLIGHYLPLPEKVRRALRFAPLAALAAIIVPELLPWHGSQLPVFDPKLLAAIAGIVVFRATRNPVLLIVSGMLTLWALRWVLGA